MEVARCEGRQQYSEQGSDATSKVMRW